MKASRRYRKWLRIVTGLYIRASARPLTAREFQRADRAWFNMLRWLRRERTERALVPF